jgi:hypothetical protein
MPLTGLAVDEGPHNMDGLLLHAWDGPERVEAFISWGNFRTPRKLASGGRRRGGRRTRLALLRKRATA